MVPLIPDMLLINATDGLIYLDAKNSIFCLPRPGVLRSPVHDVEFHTYI